ncbi:MAG: type II secretion system major pseudopilin GspG [Planctomycetota bacterium]
MNRRGLTLVEILAVLVILGLISATLVIGFSSKFGAAKHELAKTSLGTVVNHLELYKVEHDLFPTNDIGIRALTDGHATPAATYYLSQDKILDPWGREFQYLTPGPDGHPFELISFGADGQPGGDGENADITSTNLRGS